MIKNRQKWMNRLFIKKIDKTRKITFDDYGRELVPVECVEVSEINFGSIRKPNKEVLEFKIVPELIEEDKK